MKSIQYMLTEMVDLFVSPDNCDDLYLQLAVHCR